MKKLILISFITLLMVSSIVSGALDVPYDWQPSMAIPGQAEQIEGEEVSGLQLLMFSLFAIRSLEPTTNGLIVTQLLEDLKDCEKADHVLEIYQNGDVIGNEKIGASIRTTLRKSITLRATIPTKNLKAGAYSVVGYLRCRANNQLVSKANDHKEFKINRGLPFGTSIKDEICDNGRDEDNDGIDEQACICDKGTTKAGQPHPREHPLNSRDFCAGKTKPAGSSGCNPSLASCKNGEIVKDSKSETSEINDGDDKTDGDDEDTKIGKLQIFDLLAQDQIPLTDKIGIRFRIKNIGDIGKGTFVETYYIPVENPAYNEFLKSEIGTFSFLGREGITKINNCGGESFVQSFKIDPLAPSEEKTFEVNPSIPKSGQTFNGDLSSDSPGRQAFSPSGKYLILVGAYDSCGKGYTTKLTKKIVIDNSKTYPKTETICDDALDDDNDGSTDLTDSDCGGGNSGTPGQVGIDGKIPTIDIKDLEEGDVSDGELRNSLCTDSMECKKEAGRNVRCMPPEKIKKEYGLKVPKSTLERVTDTTTLLGGCGAGIAGGALVGAGIGAVAGGVVSVPGAIIGGAIGCVSGAAIGFVGGKAVTSALDVSDPGICVSAPEDGGTFKFEDIDFISGLAGKTKSATGAIFSIIAIVFGFFIISSLFQRKS